MLTVRLVAVALFGLVLGACVRNPIPVSAAGAPPLAAEDSARDRLPAGSGSWPWHRAASRTRGGGEAGGASVPRQWRGLRVEEPARCAPFVPTDYAAPSFFVPRLRAVSGFGFREPVACSLFLGPADPVVSPARVVVAEAAHDAGLCARPEARAAFAADPDNRVYVPLGLEHARAEAVARGGGDWLPSRNRCWYVGTHLRVRRRFGLSVSPWEARVFEAVLRECPVVVPAPACGGGGVPW